MLACSRIGTLVGLGHISMSAIGNLTSYVCMYVHIDITINMCGCRYMHTHIYIGFFLTPLELLMH